MVRARQLDSIAQLVRVLHWNCRAADLFPARDLVTFFAAVPGIARNEQHSDYATLSDHPYLLISQYL